MGQAFIKLLLLVGSGFDPSFKRHINDVDNINDILVTWTVNLKSESCQGACEVRATGS